MSWYLDYITRKPKLVLGVVLVLTALVGLGIPALELRNSQDSDLPADDPLVSTRQHFEQFFPDPSLVLIGVEAPDIYTPATLSKIDALSREIEGIDGVLDNRVVSIATVMTMWREQDRLVVGPLLPDGPLTAEDAERVRRKVEGDELLRGRVVSEDGTFAVVTAFLESDYDRETVYQGVQELIRRHEGPETLRAAGDVVFTSESESGVQADSQRLIPLAMLSILVALYVWFRTFLGMLLPFVAAVLSIVWALGAMGHLGLPQTVISSALPVLMIIIGSSYGIHIMLHYYHGRHDVDDPAEATRHAMRRSLPGLLMAALTTSLAAGTLLAFRVLSIRQFGIILALAVLFAVFLAVTVIPALLCLLRPGPRKRAAGPGADSGWVIRLTTWSLRHRGAVLAMALVCAAGAGLGLTRLRTGNDIVAVFPEDHSARVTFNVFNEHMGGARTINIMIDGGSPHAVTKPSYLRLVRDLQRAIEDMDGVGRTMSYADVIHGLCSQVQDDCSGLSEESIAQYLLLYDLNGTPGEFSQILDYDYQRANVTAFLTTSDPDAHDRIYAAIEGYLRQHIPDGHTHAFGGEVIFWLAQVDYVIVGKLINILATFGVIWMTMAIFYRSLRAGLFAMVPVVFGTLIIFGLMGLLGVRLDFGTAIITSVAVGVGVDFSLHYLIQLTRESRTASGFAGAMDHTARTTGRHIIYDATSNIIGFSVVLLSGFLPVRSFGLMVTIGMFAMGVSTLVVLPALIALIKPRFLHTGDAGWWQAAQEETSKRVES